MFRKPTGSAPSDPTVSPLALVPTDIITQRPDHDPIERGEWTVIRRHQEGLIVVIECIDGVGAEWVFPVPSNHAVHVKPRSGDFWGAA